MQILKKKFKSILKDSLINWPLAIFNKKRKFGRWRVRKF